jgi:hypothetical protein
MGGFSVVHLADISSIVILTPNPMHPKIALWEKGDLTRVSETIGASNLQKELEALFNSRNKSAL